MQLFDDLDRTDRSPQRYGEDAFSFYNRVAGVVWQRIREVLEEWFAAYPEVHKADLRGNFRSNIAGQHEGALWELYLHHLFTCTGYGVDVHPDLGEASGRPDFELVRGPERLYVEAAVVYSGVVEPDRDRVREAWIMDAVDKASHPNFDVHLEEFVRLGALRPKDSAIHQPLTTWLDSLDPDEVAHDFEATGQLPGYLLEVDDWLVRFEAIPAVPEARGDPGRLLGMGPITAGIVDDVEQLRDTLKHKRSKYATADVPFIVAVNCTSTFMGTDDTAKALYGSLAVRYQQGVPGSAKWIRQRDGTWIGDRGPRGTRLSAVLITVRLHPGTLATSQLALWRNPWASVPVDVDWPFSQGSCSDEGEVAFDDRPIDMAKMLGLPEGWPGPEDPWA